MTINAHVAVLLLARGSEVAGGAARQQQHTSVPGVAEHFTLTHPREEPRTGHECFAAAAASCSALHQHHVAPLASCSGRSCRWSTWMAGSPSGTQPRTT